MKIVLLLLACEGIAELLLWLPLLWRLRQLLSVLWTTSLIGLCTWLFVGHPRLWTGFIAVFGLYRAFNLLRIVKPRMHETYLKQTTFRTSLLLIVFQLIALGIFELVITFNITTTSRWAVVGALQLLLVGVLLVSTVRHIRTTRKPLVTTSYSDRDLPTLTVAIPARNETSDLEACLASLVASDYPKLEVLVIDDCSSNAKTPEIIRSFAHEGVRFVSGSEPDDTWLAKNWAYERLSEEANGELILFCGVDTRFTPVSLRHLVAVMLTKQKSMVSIMPRNHSGSWRSSLVQPMRYAWELSLPRRIFQRPPVLSTCWIVKANFLRSAGGFKAVSRSVVPEAHFARTAAVHDGYSFLRSNDVESVKPFEEQQATAIRTRYPQLHRRPELVSVVSLFELFGLVLPFVLLIASILNGWMILRFMNLIAIAGLYVTYGLVLKSTYGKVGGGRLLALPLVVFLDIVLLHTSMVRYEFSEVIWKGRNVCIPVMHVVPKLPQA